MNDEQREWLVVNLVAFTRDLDVTAVIPYLTAGGILREQHTDRV